MALQWNSGPFRGSYTTNTFSTGRAQPIQPPSLGNQYGQPGWGVMPSPLPQLPGAPEMALPAPVPQRLENTGRTAPGSSYYPGGPSAPERPGQTRSIEPPSQPQYGTPPEFRGRGRTADWRDADRDGIDDRDQDGPGMPSYWGKPANPVARPGQDRLARPPLQGTPYQQPANGTSRTDPGSGKTVTYKDGQWTWQPNPISGPQPYDTSRFGDGTPQGQQPVPPSRQPAYSRPGQAQPIAPPSQGTPYQQPTATSPAPPREPSASPPSNADRTAFDAENKKKMDRLGQLRKQQFAYIKNKKGGGYTPPSWDKEYQDLTRWALSQDTLSSVNDQQLTQIADWFPSTFGGNPNVIRRR